MNNAVVKSAIAFRIPTRQETTHAHRQRRSKLLLDTLPDDCSLEDVLATRESGFTQRRNAATKGIKISA
jgi:hypothetical protein